MVLPVLLIIQTAAATTTAAAAAAAARRTAAFVVPASTTIPENFSRRLTMAASGGGGGGSSSSSSTPRPPPPRPPRRKEYKTLAAETQYEETIKKSRFLTRAAPCASYSEAQAFLGRVADPKATHNCWAFRGASGEERSSDDGEPGGTAGRPMLSAIEGEGLADVMVVVTRCVFKVCGVVWCGFLVSRPFHSLERRSTEPPTYTHTHPPTRFRYFGGIKLGAGGLVRAYGGATRSCLRESETLTRVPRALVRVKAPLALAGAVFQVCKMGWCGGLDGLGCCRLNEWIGLAWTRPPNLVCETAASPIRFLEPRMYTRQYHNNRPSRGRAGRRPPRTTRLRTWSSTRASSTRARALWMSCSGCCGTRRRGRAAWRRWLGRMRCRSVVVCGGGV